MKRIYMILMALIAYTTSFADPITRQKAQQNAAAFLQQRNPGATLSTTTASKAPRKVNGKAVSDQAYYYVFNTDDNRGFVVASGDDVALPVLMYSTEGTFDEDSIPENMRAWLKGYEMEIQWAQENGYTTGNVENPSASVKLNGPKSLNGVVQAVPMTASKSNISYLVETTWDQNSPYYNQCKFNNTYCYTGCVATAMAQVMYYWGVTKGFKHGCTALSSYRTETKGYTVSAMSAVSTFDWSYMTASKPTSSNAINAVAKLMRYCGQSVYMDYTSSGSGAQSTDIPTALINNFGYDKGAVHVERAKYTSAEWENLIYNELANGRPVLMDGVDVDELVGHQFICDGYDASSNKFHFNWGWSGSCNDTYCALSALAPGGTGSGGTSSGNGNYTGMSGAIIGVQPPIDDSAREVSSLDQLTVEALYLVSPSVLTRDARSQDAAHIAATGVVFNLTESAHTYEFCLGIYNEDGELVETTAVRNYGEMPSGSGYYFNHDLTFGGEMPYGTYKLIPICRDAGTDTWYPMVGAGTRYLQAEISEKQITVKSGVSISMSNWKCTTSTSFGRTTYTNSVDITNNGLEEFTGELFLLVNGSMKAYLSPASIAAGATKTYTIPITTQNVANLSNKIVLTDGYGIDIAYTNISGYAEVDWDMDWDGYIDADNNLYADTYKAKFLLSNYGDDSYSHTVTATLFEKGKKVSTGTSQSKTLTVAAKNKGAVEFEFSNVTVGKTYDLQIKYYEEDGEVTDTLSNYDCAFTMARGMVVVGDEMTYYKDQDGTVPVGSDAVYVDARYSDQSANIGSGGNTNTLYLLKSGSTVPSSLSGKNVVVGDTAEIISLDHDLAFYTPVDFTATNVTYKRTFGKGFDGETANWSTIMLPFDVQDITADGHSIDWYRDSEDTGKSLWIMDFTDENNGKAAFGYPERLVANHPYIITVPADTWGAEGSLTGKELSFSGANVQFQTESPKGVVDRGERYDFIGRTYASSHTNKYSLNEVGNRFAYSDAFDIEPFCAYFVAYDQLGSQSDVVLELPAPLPTVLLMGDVNKDGEVTIADVTALVDIILGKESESGYDRSVADMNGDGVITIADVTALVDKILGR